MKDKLDKSRDIDEFNYSLTEEHAEFCGVIMGDGNIWSNGKKYEITITGNKITDKEYFNKLYDFIDHEIKRNPYYRIRGRGLRLTIYSKKFYEFITMDMGIPPRLQKSESGIPTRISKQEKLLKRFIRGVFDTDGSVFTSAKPGVSNYPTLEITNSNQKMLKEIYEALRGLNFRVHYRYSGRGSYKISIYGNKMINKWKIDIGSSNPSKLRKISTILECFC